MWMRALTLLILVGCGTEGDETSSPATPCERLRDHLVDLRLSDVRGVDIEPHRTALEQAMGADFLAACAKDLTPSQVSCGIAAADPNAAAQCVTAPTAK